MPLDLTSLQKAIKALERSLRVAQRGIESKLDAEMQETIRSGVIQDFEVAYEQCWKLMKRWMENNVNAALVDGVTRRELFRCAVESRLIDNVDLWMDFHELRNQSAHIYDERMAVSVFDAAAKFAKEARGLANILERHRA